MHILKKVLLGFGVLLLLLIAVAYALPRQIHVERSTTIAAPAPVVFTFVNGFQRFKAWSPWAKKDPDAKYTFEGPQAGVGAKMSWSGNEDVGEGSQTVVEMVQDKRVKTQLDFGEHGTATAYFDLAPDGAGTKVTWGLDTDLGMNPIARWFGLFFDGMIGPDYEQGLAALKAAAEQEAQAAAR